MKKFYPFLLFFLEQFFAAQEHSLYLKGNLVFLPAFMPNIGAEYQINSRTTIQADVFVSPWKSINGRRAQAYLGTVEGRYYFSEAFRHWYMGLNAGTGYFEITKWHYYTLHRHQFGYTFMAGAVIGYQKQLNDHWNLDFFLRGGTMQSFYKAYYQYEDVTYRTDGAEKWNKSGELLPYGGGIMLSYKLK